MKDDYRYISDESLIESLYSGDTYALNILYEKYSRALLGIALKIVNSQDIAEEVLQDAFLKIWNNFYTYDVSKGRLFTWMLNITRNIAIDRLRSKDYKKNYKNPAADIDVSIDSGLSSEEQNVDHIGLKDVLEKLNPDQKKLIDMAYFQGYKQSEIAEELGIPLGTVKTKIRSAMLNLRRYLNIKEVNKG